MASFTCRDPRHVLLWMGGGLGVDRGHLGRMEIVWTRKRELEREKRWSEK